VGLPLWDMGARHENQDRRIHCRPNHGSRAGKVDG
jgi:hypothetical protein